METSRYRIKFVSSSVWNTNDDRYFHFGHFFNVEMSLYRDVSTVIDFGHLFFYVKTSLYRDVSTFTDFGHF